MVFLGYLHTQEMGNSAQNSLEININNQPKYSMHDPPNSDQNIDVKDPCILANSCTNPVENCSNTQLDELQLKVQKYTENISKNSVINQPDDSMKRSRNKNKICFQCNSSSHLRNRCPQLNRDRNIYPGFGQCKQCGSFSHWRNSCPYLNRGPI